MFEVHFDRVRACLTAAVFSGAAVCAGLAHANNVIVLDSGEAQLSLIDEATHKVVATEPAGKEPHHLMITPDGRSLIIANSVSGNLMLVDPKTGSLQRWIEDIEDPYQLGFSPDHQWFVTNALRLNADRKHSGGRYITRIRHADSTAIGRRAASAAGILKKTATCSTVATIAANAFGQDAEGQ